MLRFAYFYLVLIIFGSLGAQEKQEQTAEEIRHERMLKLAQSYELTGDSPAKIALRERPIFSWANPEVKSIGGELYLWTAGGQPVATIGIWTYDDVTDSFELQSLCTHSIDAQSKQAVPWRPRVGGLTFVKLEGVPTPDNAPARRQTQMRNVLRQKFTGEITKNDSGQIEKLRLLSQPIYRYDPMPANLIDGAIFAFAYGTDPEIFVLLEARKTDSGPQWYYAFAPATSRRARGYLDGQKLWDNDDQSANGTFLFVRR